MAISSFFVKLSETDDEVTYSFGEDRDCPDDTLVFDKTLFTAQPVSGLRTFGFNATARGIYRRYRETTVHGQGKVPTGGQVRSPLVAK